MSRYVCDLEENQKDSITVVAAGSVSAVALVSGAAYLAGKAVTITGQRGTSPNIETIMGYGSAGDPLRGIIDHYEDDGYMTVQNKGYRTASGVSASLPVANDFVCVYGDGAVSKATSTSGVGPAYAASVDNTADVNTVMVFIG